MSEHIAEHLKRSRMTLNPVSEKLEIPDGPVHDYYKEESERPFNSLEQVIKKQKQNEKDKSSSLDDSYSHLLANNESFGSSEKVHYGDVNLDDDDDGSEDSNSILVGSRSVPKIMIKFKTGTFGMYSNVPVQQGSDATLQHFTDKVEKSFENMDVIFSMIKKSLLSYTPSSELANNEMMIEIKELDLVLEEDNKYNKNITLQDLCSIYRSLSDNTKKDEEDAGILTFEIKTKKRFLNRYNELVELVDNRGNLMHIKKFSNDSGHPVVLDDDDDDESHPHIDKRIINTTNSSVDDEEIVVLD
ncbi:hypothetical protein FOG51_00624 [Hanseniaspora uvarum]|nr:hypothetical protein FOG48_00453 [Hanseniaspora uvarum]KAF0274398.1 hypothetical protein FOG51_00624 [Hanseniaspora uvarum]GMM40757.1 Rmr1 protein [Hanseniaspora uvarum]